MNSRDEVMTPPEGYSRMANISPEDLGRIMSIIPDMLNIADVAEIIFNIVVNFGMEKELPKIFIMVGDAVVGNGIVQKAIEIDDLDLSKGAN